MCVCVYWSKAEHSIARAGNLQQHSARIDAFQLVAVSLRVRRSSPREFPAIDIYYFLRSVAHYTHSSTILVGLCSFQMDSF